MQMTSGSSVKSLTLCRCFSSFNLNLCFCLGIFSAYAVVADDGGQRIHRILGVRERERWGLKGSQASGSDSRFARARHSELHMYLVVPSMSNWHFRLVTWPSIWNG